MLLNGNQVLNVHAERVDVVKTGAGLELRIIADRVFASSFEAAP